MTDRPNEMMFPEPCLAHMSSNDDECETCLAEMAAIEKQKIDTDKETLSIISQLGLQGYEVDPLVHVAIRLDTLISSLMGRNAKAVAKFDTTVSVNVLREMVRQQAEAARERLLS